jgi:glucokinase-like ROK family protein
MTDVFGLGIDIGGTKTVIAAIDTNGNPLKKCRLSSPDLFHSKQTPAFQLAAEIRQYCATNQMQVSWLKGVVIGFPGVMDPATQVITSCPNLTELDGIPLGKQLTEELQIPVMVENDVNLIAVGEQYQGGGKGVQDLACIMVGSGIGCGLIINGSLYRGANGAAGEFGHMIIQPDGLPCTCGSRGCLEMYCSGKALSAQAQKILGTPVESDPVLSEAGNWSKAETVIQAARNGQPGALEAMYSAFRYLGFGVTDLVNIMNPRLVLLGGGILTGWPEGLEVVRQTVNEFARVAVKDHLRIEPTLLNENASFTGAFLLIQQLMQPLNNIQE